MKSTKKFFDDNAKLNKGYADEREESMRPLPQDLNANLQAMSLLPVEVLAEYENIYPGTLAKMFKMAEDEQNYQQRLNFSKQANFEKLVNILDKIALFLPVILSCLIVGILGKLLSFSPFEILISYLIVLTCLNTNVMLSKSLFKGIFSKFKSSNKLIEPELNSPQRPRHNKEAHNVSNTNNFVNSNNNHRRKLRKVNFKKV